MTGVSEVPIVEVDAGNIVELWPSLVHAIRSSTFIAIDTVSSVLKCKIVDKTSHVILCCGTSLTL